MGTFCDLFNFANLIHSETCLMINHTSTIDRFWTNKLKSFFKTPTTEAGVSDYYKLVSTFFKLKAPRLKPKVIFYRNYKKFDEKGFLDDHQNKKNSMSSDDLLVNYKFLTKNFLETIDKHAPLKTKFIRGNQAPFMNRDSESNMQYKQTK